MNHLAKNLKHGVTIILLLLILASLYSISVKLDTLTKGVNSSASYSDLREVKDKMFDINNKLDEIERAVER